MQRNYILFILLSALVLGVWYWFAAPSFAPKKKGLEEKKLVKGKSEQEKKAEKKKAAPEPKKIVKEEKKPPTKEIAKEEPPHEAMLGGDGYHLSVDTTARGAGVWRVILNRFEAADWQGRPVADRKLHLVQEDKITPSYRMYHYADPDDQNPVFGLGEKIWKYEGREDRPDKTQLVRYATTVPGMEHIKIRKTFKLSPTDYHVTMLLEFQDLRTDEKAPKKPFRYQIVGAHGLPIEGEFYASTFRNAIMGMTDKSNNLWRHLEDSARIGNHKGGDRFPEGNRGDLRMQYGGVVNQYFAAMMVIDNEQPSRDDGGVEPGKIMAWARPTLEASETKGFILRMGATSITFRDKSGDHVYHLLPRTSQHLKDLDVQENQPIALSWYETPDGKRVATWARLGATPRAQFDDITVRFNSETIELFPKDKIAHQFLLYHGPVKAALLAQQSGDSEVPVETVDRYTDTLHLSTLTDYRSDNVFGKFSNFIGLTKVIIYFTRLMHWLFYKLHAILPYGLAIMALTVLVRGAMFPISRRQALLSIKMQELAPEMKKIAEKFKDDMAARSAATSELQRKHGVHPLSSCWPVLLQMPIFLGLYFAMQESIHFRLAEFLWIKNLAAPDMLIWWSEHIPWISVPDSLGGMLYLGPYFNLLPVVAVALMMVQQMQTMPPPTDEQSAAQQKMMKFMTLFFGIMFYKVAAGLCIYFIASSAWGCAERMLLPKKKASQASGGAATVDAVAGPVPTPQPNGKWKNKRNKPEKKDDTGLPAKLKAWWLEVLKQAEKK